MVGLVICVNHILTAPFRPSVFVLGPSLLMPLFLLSVSPIPWQWSGDDRLKPGILRGVGQALAFNAVWMGLIAMAVWRSGPSEFPRGAEPPGLVLARLGLWGFALIAVMGFGWLWAEKEVSEAREGMLADLVHELGEMQIQDRKLQEEREGLIRELQEALHDVQTLTGLIPICASCKKVRDDRGYWQQVEGYIQQHTLATFTHGICPECAQHFRDEAQLGTRSNPHPS